MEAFTVQPFLVARQNWSRKAWSLTETFGSMHTSPQDIAEAYLEDTKSNTYEDEHSRLAIWRLHPSHMSCGRQFNWIHGDERPHSVYGDVFEVEMAPRLVR